MPFPQNYADALFARLAVRYGAAFMSQWRDVDPSAVKADWCDVLDGWEKLPKDIAWALANLPEKPINAVQFRSLLRAAPREQEVLLPAPKANPELVEKIMQEAKFKVRAEKISEKPAESVISGIIERGHRNGGLSIAQIDFLRTCLTMLPDDHPHRETLHVMSGGRIGYPKEPS